jgi:hypothetical protein
MTKRAPKEIFARRMADTSGLIDRLLNLVGTIPTPREGRHEQPQLRSRVLARRAALKAASAAGTLALPPGPLGWLTIAPELYAVWRIQAQLVADIAGVHGKPELLSREQMLYCLFGHTAASSVSDLVIRVGERYVVRRQPLAALYAIGNKVALRVVQRSAGRVASRWIPALGALGVAGYVYADTGHVATASIELFAADLMIADEAPADEASAGGSGSAAPASASTKPSPGRRAAAKPAVRRPAKRVAEPQAAVASRAPRRPQKSTADARPKAAAKAIKPKAGKTRASKVVD